MTTQTLTLWETIGQSGRAPICAFDHEFRLIAFNQAHSDEFFRIYGYRVKEGDVFPDLFLPEQAPVIRAFMQRALNGEAFNVVEEFGDPSLDRPHWDIAYAPLRDSDGAIIGAFHHAQDISARLRAEAELAAAQEALRQSQKMEAVGQLTGGIAHDFNNLLMAISGNLQLLSRKLPPDHPGQKFISNMGSAAATGSRLTSQLLAFSRTQKLNIQSVPLDQALLHAKNLIDNALGPTVSVNFALNAGDALAATDSDQLELALLNLALNARDAMPQGGALRIESAANEPGFVTIRVSDKGVGMSPEVASKATEPFFTTKERGKGSGLGLAQVYGFVKQCGGDLQIFSEPGLGTTIQLRLLRAEAKSDQEALADPLDNGATSPGGGQTLLVVDDHDNVRALLTEILTAGGFNVVEAAGGEEALQKAKAIRPAAAIIDFIMPGMNGDEVARRLRKMQPDLPIVFVSGYFDTLALDRISGAVVLRKPFDVQALLNAVSAAAA